MLEELEEMVSEDKRGHALKALQKSVATEGGALAAYGKLLQDFDNLKVAAPKEPVPIPSETAEKPVATSNTLNSASMQPTIPPPLPESVRPPGDRSRKTTNEANLSELAAQLEEHHHQQGFDESIEELDILDELELEAEEVAELAPSPTKPAEVLESIELEMEEPADDFEIDIDLSDL